MPKTPFFVSWRLCVKTMGVGSGRRPSCVHLRPLNWAFAIWYFAFAWASASSVPSAASQLGIGYLAFRIWVSSAALAAFELGI
jgi:hypothetical protein